MQRNGWAIECRINAEDPQRSFLPSTGRLSRYVPPRTTMQAAAPVPDVGGVRVDTGVYEGGEIPMYYDSMIAKLIVHASDRAQAIARMREALNGFVIRGISSNIAFQSALLAHPKFAAGDFNTGFIAEHFAHGFRMSDVPHGDPLFLVAMAAFVRRKARERSAGISGQLAGHGVKNRPDLVVVVLKPDGAHEHHAVRVEGFDPVAAKADVVIEESAPRLGKPSRLPKGNSGLGRPGGRRRFAIQSPTQLGDILVNGICNGKPFTAQIERGSAKHPLGIRVTHNGLQIEALVLLPRAAELLKLMPHKAPPDLSKFLLSPMPGLLVDVAVQPGQKVMAGERLAVIEAMKMENILTATQDGEVREVLARAWRKPHGRPADPGVCLMQRAMDKPFRILGLQQVAIGGPDKQRLRALWVDMLGLSVKGNFVSERENVDEDICAIGSGVHEVEVDLMQPMDPSKKPAVHATPLNHVGLWVDDLPKAVAWMTAHGVRFAPGGIRKGAAGHDICFIHPKGSDDFPIGGEGVLIELVQAPPDVVQALSRNQL